MSFSYIRIPLAALLLLTALVSGCKQADRSKSPDKTTAQIERQKTTEEISPPVIKPSTSSADELRRMVQEQQDRGMEIKKQIAALGNPASRDSEQVRKLLLQRKGELLMALKRIRHSDQLTPSQKDSLMKPIENESMEISKQMLAVSQ